MNHKFFKKFFLTTTLIIIASITLITIILSFFVSSYLRNDKLVALKGTCDSVVEFTKVLDVKDVNRLKSPKVFKSFSQITDVQIFISDIFGEVYFCGCNDWEIYGICNHNVNLVPDSILASLEKGEHSENGDLDGFFSSAYFIHAKSLRNGEGDKIGYVFAFLSPTSIEKFYNKILWMFFISAIIPLVVMFVAEFIISYRFTKPLRLMAEASSSIARGDFSKRIPVTGNDEISELAVAFNQMINSLVQTESTRRSFIANVSHELKTPMTSISGFIDGMLDGTILEEKHSYYIGIISNEVKRLSRLVQSMLSLSKLESGEMQISKTKFSLTDAIFETVVSFESRIESKKLEILGLDSIEQISLNADKDLIFQVIYNLVDNAVKFTNEGGKITFSVQKDGGFVKFIINNTGTGIKKEDLPFVFDRFYKTDRSRSMEKDSMGLGLYIASTIVSIHGGKILVRSLENKFTEFEVNLLEN